MTTARSRKPLLALLASMATLPGGTRADDGLIPWPPPARYAEGEARCRKPLPDAARTVLGLRVDEAAVDVAEGLLGPLPLGGEGAFGPSPLHHEGDASESVSWRCWEAANGDGTVLYLARGEVGGALRLVAPDMVFAGRGSCLKSELVHRGLAMANGLRLGLARAQVEKRVGPASRVGKRWYERACVTKRRLAPEEFESWGASPEYPFVDVFSAVRVVEKDGRAVGVEIRWSETY